MLDTTQPKRSARCRRSTGRRPFLRAASGRRSAGRPGTADRRHGASGATRSHRRRSRRRSLCRRRLFQRRDDLRNAAVLAPANYLQRLVVVKRRDRFAQPDRDQADQATRVRPMASLACSTAKAAASKSRASSRPSRSSRSACPIIVRRCEHTAQVLVARGSADVLGRTSTGTRRCSRARCHRRPRLRPARRMSANASERHDGLLVAGLRDDPLGAHPARRSRAARRAIRRRLRGSRSARVRRVCGSSRRRRARGRRRPASERAR